jgi:hypothetical protein
MKALSKLCFGLLVVLAGTIGYLNLAYAQTATLTNEQTIEVVVVGTLGGALLSYQNLQGKTWSTRAFIEGIVHSALVTVPIAVSAALTSTNLNLLGLVLVFFASIGITTTIQNERTPSTPANKPTS